jgi:membrane-associated phospholipid phosphatase
VTARDARLDDARGYEPPSPSAPWPLLSLLAACVAVFTELAVDITHNGPLDRLDQRVARWADGLSGVVRTWSWHLTHLGDDVLLATLIVLVAASLLWRRRALDAIVLCAAASATGLLTTVLKLAFERSRPPFVDQVRELHSFSFPSGHASGAFCVYLLFGLLLSEGLGRAWRVAAVIGGLGVASMVGISRVLILVHYLTDVIAGSALGLAVAVTAWLVRVALRSGR